MKDEYDFSQGERGKFISGMASLVAPVLGEADDGSRGTNGLTIEQVVARATEAIFGKPLVTNVHRSIIVEAIVASALGEAWKWCSADYAGWDFEHEDGTRLEVKQSAAPDVDRADRFEEPPHLRRG